MSTLPIAPDPPTPLGRYRLLSPTASIRVSPIALGGMSIGDKWGNSTKEGSFRVIDAYYEAGGNFIDTANGYQDGSSEELIGEWMELRGNRDQMVVATKYSSPWKRHDPSVVQKVHYTGNGTKSMHVSVDASLRKLRTSYIDILYVHWYDWDTSVQELMGCLHNLVVAGKVLHLGISDSPAWFVTKANQYATDHGKTPFCIYQGQWNLALRSFERDIIPMARAEGMALAPWDVLARGKFRTEAEAQIQIVAGDKGRVAFGSEKLEASEDEKKVSAALEKVAADVGANSIQAVAIAYHLQKTPYVFPIIGVSKIEKLHKNIEALQIRLSDEQMVFLESALPFDVGFPNWLIGDGTKEHDIMKISARLDVWPKPEPIRPA